MEHTKLDPAKLAAGIASGALANHPYLPILIAATKGACDMMSVFQADKGQVPPAFEPLARKDGRGVVVSIGDDLDESRGTAAFDVASLSALLAQAKLIVLQVAMFQQPIMAHIARMASQGLVVVVIETREMHEIEWINFVKDNSDCPTILVTPRPEQ